MVVIEEEKDKVDRPSVTPEFVCTCGMCAMSERVSKSMSTILSN